MKSNLLRRKVPVDIIFSEKNMVEESHEYYDELSIWRDVPIVNLEPCIAGLNAFLWGKGSLDPYIDFKKKQYYPAKMETEVLLRQLSRTIGSLRPRLFRQLPTVAELERDRLVLRSGNIQCCLSKLKNVGWLDVLMPESVAEQWDARSTEEVDAEVKKQGRKAFYTPILHERYRKCKVSRPGRRRLDLIRRFLGPVHKRLTLLDIGCNTGFYTFHFYRQGFDTTGIDFDPSHLAIARAQRSMYSAEIPFELCTLSEYASDKKFDIVLALSVFYHILGWGEMPASMTPNQLGEKLDSLVGHVLFWESGKRCDDEIAAIRNYSGLQYYTNLGRTWATGIENREFGVFTRRPPAEIQAYFLRNGNNSNDQPLRR